MLRGKHGTGANRTMPPGKRRVDNGGRPRPVRIQRMEPEVRLEWLLYEAGNLRASIAYEQEKQ